MADTQDFCVIITRPEPQARQWAASLESHGINSTNLNVLEIVPITDATSETDGNEERVRAIKNRILDFDLYQKAIFVSQNAVEYGMQWIENYWPQLPIGIDFFAVGATTAKKLSDYGIAVTDLAVSGNGGMTSEDLLRAPGLREVEGQKIIIFRGCGGRGHMGDELRQRGAWVDYCELYERRLPVSAAQQLQQLHEKIVAGTRQHLLSVHSGESLENVLQLLQSASPLVKDEVLSLPLLVPSQRVAANAAAKSFANIICAENATDEAMTRALLAYRAGK